MGLEKGIEHKKEKRKPYSGVKKYCSECRNHGGCDWCENNRLYQTRKMREKTDYDLKAYNLKAVWSK